MDSDDKEISDVNVVMSFIEEDSQIEHLPNTPDI